MNDFSFISSNPNYSIRFHNEEKIVGTLDFNGPEIVFNGDCNQSAKVFIDFVAQSFASRLKEERNSALEQAALLFNQPHMEYFGENIQNEIRALKQEVGK